MIFKRSYNLGFGKGKYKYMKINPKTNMPFHIPSIASEKLNVRLKPAQKWAIKKLGIQNRQSMSKAVLEIFNFYFENAVPSNFWDDIEIYDPAFKEEQSNLSKNQMALQGVEDFFKATNTPKGAIPLPKQTKTLEGLFMRKKRCFSRAA